MKSRLWQVVMFALGLALVLGVGAGTGKVAQAQVAAVPLGDFRYWSAYTYKDSGQDACYAYTKALGKGAGEAFLVLTINKAEGNLAGVINLESPFGYALGAPVTLVVGDKEFAFAPYDNMAWLAEGANDTELIDALLKGEVAVVKYTSAAGKGMVERYSLAGFTAARWAISKRCGEENDRED